MAAKNFHEWWQDNGALEDCSFSVIAELAWNAATRLAEEKFIHANNACPKTQDSGLRAMDLTNANVFPNGTLVGKDTNAF